MSLYLFVSVSLPHRLSPYPLACLYDQLSLQNLDSNSSLFSYSRSNGHKLLMLFTDGIDDWDVDMLNDEIQKRDNDPVGQPFPLIEFHIQVQIFGFSMGYGTGHLEALQWMACSTYGNQSGGRDSERQRDRFTKRQRGIGGQRDRDIFQSSTLSWTSSRSPEFSWII